jgi:hypothetical protein
MARQALFFEDDYGAAATLFWERYRSPPSRRAPKPAIDARGWGSASSATPMR